MNNSFSKKIKQILEEKNLDEIPQSFLEALQNYLNAFSCSFYAVEFHAHREEELILRGCFPFNEWANENVDIKKIIKDENIAGKCLLKGEVIFEIIELDSTTHTIPPDKDIKSVLGIPLFIGDKIIGIICINWKEKKYFTDEQIKSINSEVNSQELIKSLENFHLYQNLKFEKSVIMTKNSLMDSFNGKKYFKLENLYNDIVDVVGSTYNLQCCSFLVHNVFDNSITVRSIYPKEAEKYLTKAKYNVDNSSTGDSIIKQEIIETIDLQNDSKFQNKDLAINLKLYKLYSIPIFINRDKNNNENHKKIYGSLNLYPKNHYSSFNMKEMEFIKNVIENQLQQSYLFERNQLVNMIENEFNNNKKLIDFCDSLITIILDYLQVEGISIFLYDHYHSRYNLISSSGINNCKERNEIFYYAGDGLTGHLLSGKYGQTLICADVKKHENHKGIWRESTSHEGKSFIGTLLYDNNKKIIGCIRCTNKIPKFNLGFVDIFSQDDKDLFEFIGKWMSTFIQIYLAEDLRKRMLLQTTHEAQSPLVGIKTKARKLIKTFNHNSLSDKKKLKYLSDIYSHATQLSYEINLTELANEEIKLNMKPTYIFGEIIIPAINDLESLCNEKNLPHNKIKYEPYEKIPKIYLDKKRFSQVVYNLLNNAIKYSFDDPEAFDIKIRGEDEGKNVKIIIQDYGMGIKEEYKEDIFLMGFRTPEARKKDVSGRGLGLSIINEIVKKHGGRILLTHCMLPTEFTIELPK